MTEAASQWDEPKDWIIAGPNCLARYDTSIWIFSQNFQEEMLIYEESQELDSSISDVFDRICQGFRCWQGHERTEYSDSLAVRSAVQLELHLYYVSIKNLTEDQSILLFESNQHRFCLGFYCDLKVGFAVAGIPTKNCVAMDEESERLAGCVENMTVMAAKSTQSSNKMDVEAGRDNFECIAMATIDNKYAIT